MTTQAYHEAKSVVKFCPAQFLTMVSGKDKKLDTKTAGRTKNQYGKDKSLDARLMLWHLVVVALGMVSDKGRDVITSVSTRIRYTIACRARRGNQPKELHVRAWKWAWACEL